MKNPRIEKICRRAKAAAENLATATTEIKNQALDQMAEDLLKSAQPILKANRRDLLAAKKKKLSPALMDRLMLDEKRLGQIAQALRDVAKLPDPVQQVIRQWRLPNGLQVSKVRIPIGVIGIIYEARPNVTADAASLCIKSGNAVILKGGSEAEHSNRAIARILAGALKKSGLHPDGIQLVPSGDRSAIRQLLQMDAWIDLLIPRGGESLIRFVAAHSRIPVIKHYKGVCHLYIDASADSDMAVEICLNAKVQRPGVCNAIETVLVHRSQEYTLLPRLVQALQSKGVEVRGSRELIKRFPGMAALKSGDFGREFLDLILPVKVVESVDEAIEHVRRHGSQHTESIVTENPQNAEKFLHELRSSMILVNASTRFNDGGEMGMGAEVGISTTKLHAFGPMGIEDLTIGHYRVVGTGQVRN